MLNKVIEEIISWGKSLFYAVAVSLLITIFLFQPYTVSGSSMEPTLTGLDPSDESKIGDRVMLYKSAYIFGKNPSYGDIVVIDSHLEKKRTLKDDFFDSPLIGIVLGNYDEEKKFWIKRVIGQAGDTLEFNDGKVYRNGQELDEEYIKEDMVFPFEKVTVPRDHVFVMGDNRNYSKDSREIGTVPVENVVGKVIFRFYPFHKVDKY